VVNTTNGNVAQRLDYDAWGNVLANSAPGFQPFGFAGGLYDVETGLVYFGARDYDPTVGRWGAKDPIRFAGKQANLYVYSGDDPVNRVDPTGLGCTIANPWWEDQIIQHPYRTWAVTTVAVSAAVLGGLELIGAAEEATPVIGRLPDTGAFANRAGFEIIKDAGWSPQANAAWVQGHIDAGNAFQLASPITEVNILSATNASGYTVYADEISQILNAGYSWEGELLLPP
jgi:RHS repeat-associated protein